MSDALTTELWPGILVIIALLVSVSVRARGARVGLLIDDEGGTSGGTLSAKQLR